MAQTRRKRRTKHRGNAMGAIETRGRTGRPATPAERKAPSARQARMDRYDRPPNWRSAATRSLAVVVVFFAVVVLGFGQPIGSAVMLSAFMLAIYIPMGYYTDLFLYRRRQAKKLQAQRRSKDG